MNDSQRLLPGSANKCGGHHGGINLLTYKKAVRDPHQVREKKIKEHHISFEEEESFLLKLVPLSWCVVSVQGICLRNPVNFFVFTKTL